MEIAKMCTLSTEHISMETDQWLTEQSKEPTEGLCVYEKAGGHFIHVPDFLSFEIMELPEDLEEIIAYILSDDIDWICLDSDGPVETMFPTYNW